MVAPGTDTSAVFTGGASYDVGGMIEVAPPDGPSTGDYVIDPLKRVIVDGDMIAVLEYPTDFTLVP
jgi:hypothetical protein